MKVIQVTQDNFKKEVLESKLPVLVDFYAVWCGPCKMAAPVLDELAKEHKGKVKIVKVNVDEEQELAKEYQVMSIPTVVSIKDGKEVERKMGFGGKVGYEELLKKMLDE